MREQRAPYRGALFALNSRVCRQVVLMLAVLLAGLPAAQATEPACQASRYNETVVVRHVHDGDTVWLRDGRRLRLIGLDTPELGRDGRPPQAYAEAARDSLRALLRDDRRLRLVYDAQRRDRYGRLLARAYLMDGRDVAAVLLRQGLATTLVVPPNLAGVDCHAAAEQVARLARRGIWSLPAYQVMPAARLGAGDTGFHLLRGRVLAVERDRHGWWLVLPGQVLVHIRDEDLVYFNGLDPRTLRGREVVARGWLHYHKHWHMHRHATRDEAVSHPARQDGGRLSLRVRHPAALSVME